MFERYKLITIVICALIFPTLTFAFPINGYFQQSVHIQNNSSKVIAVLEADNANLNNYPVSPTYYLECTYKSDQFTNPLGQSFSHTININSGIDNTSICTITSHLSLTGDSSSQSHPTSSDPSKCETSVTTSFGIGGEIFGFKIIVKE